MHVLVLGSYAPSLLNFRGPLLRDMIDAGHRVSVAAPDMSSELRANLSALGTQVHETVLQRTGTGILDDLRYCRALTRLLRKVRPDLLLTYTIKPNIWGAFAARLVGIPSVAMVTGLGYAFSEPNETGGAKRRLVAWLARTLYRRATSINRRVIFQNPDDVADFVAAGCLADPSKVRLVSGSGVDLDHYRPTPLPPKPRFLMISRLLKNKGVREYGEAATRLKREMPEVSFDLVGYLDEGPDGIAVTDLDRWIADGLNYLGPQADVRPFISAASVYVLPSYREGTPRSSLEAMAMGRPVVTSDAPGCRETVINNETGLLVPARDVNGLMDAMRKLAADDALRNRMGGASLALARERFDVHKVNAQMLAILDDAK